MYAKVGHLPDPYRLDVAYADGKPIGTVEKLVMGEPDPDRLGPCIRRASREGFTVRLQEFGDGDGEARKSFSGLRDTWEVLDKVRTVAENYQRPRRSWWASVPADQYSFTKFL